MKVVIHSVGTGQCALTGKEGEGLSVSFENEPQVFLTWKSFRLLCQMKAGLGRDPKPAPARVNGPVLAAE